MVMDPELHSGHSVASTASLSAVIFRKPRAGSNEQYAGEGVFLTQRRDSSEPPFSCLEST